MSVNQQLLLDDFINRDKESYDVNQSESQFFEFFTAKEILKNEDLSIDEIEDGLTGGSSDGGIDSFYLFIDDRLIQDEEEEFNVQKQPNFKLYIIQSSVTPTFSEDKIIKMQHTLQELFDLSREENDLAKTYCEKLIDKVMLFRKLYRKYSTKFPKLEIKIYYTTRSIKKAHLNVRNKSARLERSIIEMFNDLSTVSFDFMGASELWNLANKSPITKINMTITSSPISTSKKDSVCLVNIHEYFKFLIDEQSNLRKSIFESNVRDYQGSVEVNQSIGATLKDNSINEDFWWLNNGVTIVCNNFKFTGNELTIEDPQIVNGLQTSNQIYNHFKERLESNENRAWPARHVLVRIINPESENGRDKIIKATNSQTAILPGQLHATDPIQKDIESFFTKSELFYDRRKNYYKNQGKPRDSIISISGLAQALNAIHLQKPHLSRAKPASLIKNDGIYKEIFNPNFSLALFLNIARLMMKIEKFMKTEEGKKYSRDLKYHLAMYAVAYKLQKLKPDPNDFENELHMEDAYLVACMSSVSKTVEELAAIKNTTLNKEIKANESTEKIIELLRKNIKELKTNGEILSL